jgi:hypothetical protein
LQGLEDFGAPEDYNEGLLQIKNILKIFPVIQHFKKMKIHAEYG